MIKSLTYNKLDYFYKKIIRKELIYKLNIKNNYNIPKIKRVTLLNLEKKLLINKYNIIYSILYMKGLVKNKASLIKSKKSISNFKLREKSVIGLKVSLHRNMMYDFIDETIHLVLPKLKRFKKLKILKMNSKKLELTSINLSINDINLYNNIEEKLYIYRLKTGFYINIDIESIDSLSIKLLLNSLKIKV